MRQLWVCSIKGTAITNFLKCIYSPKQIKNTTLFGARRDISSLQVLSLHFEREIRKGLQTKNGSETIFQISKICDRNLPCKVDASFFVPCMNNCVVLSADRADTQIFFSMRAGWKSPHPCKLACANTWATIN